MPFQAWKAGRCHAWPWLRRVLSCQVRERLRETLRRVVGATQYHIVSVWVRLCTSLRGRGAVGRRDALSLQSVTSLTVVLGHTILYALSY